MRLEGKVAVVTGAGSGFGAGIAERFVAEGAAVLVNDVNDENGERIAKSLRDAGGRAAYLHGDVSKDADTGAMLAEP
jgi:3-oxoacyl-[acyl-carrier protein] reductase